jgi:beta-glucosidase
MDGGKSLAHFVQFVPALMSISMAVVAQPRADIPLYRDASQPVHRRVEDLLSRMTLEEKLGQLNMPCVYVEELGKDPAAKMEGCRKFTLGSLEEGLGPGGGFFTLPNTALHEGTRQQAEFLNELQDLATGKTRLGIPLLMTEEGTHGLMCSGATIFPEGPALGSTWNTALIRDIYTVVAREARSIGIHQVFTLVIEPNRDPRLGRNQEGYSEDPYLVSRFAESIVRGVQGDNVAADDRVVAGLCHYPGQSQPVSGLERGAIEYSERVFREVFLPPWIAGIRNCGALGVMATYPSIGGVPVHSSDTILTTLLREELGFQGLVLSEGGGISTLVYEGLAPSQKEAGAQAIAAGVDVGISYETAYMGEMRKNIAEGRVPMEQIDRAVRRILTQKFRLGLFEKSTVDPHRALQIVHASEHRDLALRAAREGIVLLKNDGNLLPLRKDLKRIAVFGPNADHVRNQLGDYTAWTILQDVETILEGIRAAVSPQTRVDYIRGCNVFNRNLDEIAKAKKAAQGAGVAIVVVGENAWHIKEDQITNGEGYDIASLDMTGMQEDLIRAIQETGTPTVAVLVNGRPLSIRWTAEHVPAILETWLSGERGGTAVAEVLFGDCNPGGRLPVTIPRHVGQLPAYYNYKKSKQYWMNSGWSRPYADMSAEPLFCFGHGLSYTSFQYANLIITPDVIFPAGIVRVSVDVTNTGGRAGEEVVQLYINDVIATVATPYKELKGFEKIALKPGEKRTVSFELNSEHLSLLDRNMKRVVEPGAFEVMIGHSSKDIRLTGRFEVRN